MPNKLKDKKTKSNNFSSEEKLVTIQHQHTKPYRKHHLGLLVFFVVAFLVLFVTAVQYRTIVTTSVRDGLQFVSDLSSGESKDYKIKVSSSYGFNLQYDQKDYYATAIDTVTGELMIGSDLTSTRPYGVLRIAKSDVLSKFSAGALTITYHSDQQIESGKLLTADSLTELAISDGNIKRDSFDKSEPSKTTLGSKEFTKTTWTLKPQGGLLSSISSKFDTYVAIFNNKPLTIIVSYGLDGKSTQQPFKEILDSINFSNQTANLPLPSTEISGIINANKTFLSSMLLGNVASAASESNMTGEKLSALNSPAVVKIYNFYCKDIKVEKGPIKLSFVNLCSASMGSGFFVSQDGHIATNGHVATATAKDLSIQTALAYLAQGKPDFFQALLSMTTLKESDVNGKSENEKVGVSIDLMYNLPESYFSETNKADNLLVLLNKNVPDLKSIWEYTNQRKAFPESDNLKKAEILNYNFRTLDNIAGTGYKGSDVALIKIGGSSYPIVQLGNIDDVSSGSELYILGYPGVASTNSIVESDNSVVTLTKGTVSSIKNLSGDTRKVIETDTTIGHGNSGGPAFSNKGRVVGISTYRADGAGRADASYNYVRDIEDFKKIVTEKNINLDTKSKTQDEWIKAIDNFYTSRYSKALVGFRKVKEYYAFTTNVDKFIKESEDAIAAGKDVQDFPTVWVIIGSSVALIGIGVTVFMMIRHRKKHAIYKENVASGNIQPIQPGSAPQQIRVSTQPAIASNQPQSENQDSTKPSTPVSQDPASNQSQSTPNTTTQPIDYFGKKN